MELLALLPGFVALYVALRTSASRAFLEVYLPVLFLFPDYYRWIAPALPDPNFNMAAILPIAILYFLREWSGWRFSVGDFLVGGYAFCLGYSEYRNAGYGDAQNLMFEALTCVLLPYMLAKAIIEPAGMRVAYARRIVWFCFMISLISLYEFKMGSTPWRMAFDRFFPTQADGWVTTFRWGFARVAGPYGHAILAGVILVIAYRLQRWLEWSGHWEPRFRRLPWLPVSKARAITLGSLLGVLMTMVRGPWIAGLLGALVTGIGRRGNRWAAVAVILLAVVLAGLPVGYLGYRYVSVGRINAKTVAQESAAYRKELIDKYIDIALDHAAWGWGRATFPRVDGMTSIDNHFLLIALMHGAIAVAFLVSIFLWQMGRLFWRGMTGPESGPPGNLFSFTLLGIYWVIFAAIVTVYMGNQLNTIFFLFAGWTEGYLLTQDETSSADEPAAAPSVRFAPRFEFERVIE